ncbi:probable MFS transporter [marine gamma proteobacterium HTCC2143]|uniref:Probable MFS transporter n=1 Tax=marine gamma proteobacterium HTCC2143 TaxID=247633 RepID=A0Y8F1_9GAMM|nr:probable MFS transporter [marine gamma proteobacterium HTCC2143]
MPAKNLIRGNEQKHIDDYPSSREANYVLGLLFLAYAFSFIDRQVLGVMVGPIKEDLALSDFQFSLLQGAAFAILYSVMALPFGRMADTKNRKLIMAMGVFGWSLMTIGCGLAKNFTQLFVMRMGVGVGEAALSPAAYSTITDSFPREKLTRALAIYKAGMLVGGGLALLLGGIIYDYYASIPDLSMPLLGAMKAWQATFVTVGLPGFLLAVMILFIKEPGRKGMLRSPEDDSPKSLKIGEVFAFMFVQHHQLYISLFVGCSILAIISYGFSSWFTEMLIRNFSLTRSYAGSLMGSVIIAAGLLGVLSGPSFVALLQKRGFADSNMRALMLITIALIPTAIAAPQMPNYILALVLMSVTVFLQAAYVGVAAAAVQMVTPNQMRGQATAIYLFSTNMLGLALGSTLVAGLTDFVFANERALMHSLSLISAILLPLAAYIFWKGLNAFSVAIKRSEDWS